MMIKAANINITSSPMYLASFNIVAVFASFFYKILLKQIGALKSGKTTNYRFDQTI